MRRVHLILIIVVSLLILLSVLIFTLAQVSLLQQIAAIFLGFLGGMAAIAEIVGLFDRFGVPDAVFPAESKYIKREQSPFETTVAIWGPTASGKSWLIRAFAQAVKQKYNGNYLGLQFKLTKVGTDFPDSDITLNVPATGWIDYFSFRFERALVHKSENKQNPSIGDGTLCNRAAIRHAQLGHSVERQTADQGLCRLRFQ